MASRYKKVDRLRFRVKLTCGHEVKTVNNPLTDNTKFGCMQGMGCGYNLHWVSWRNVENDQTGYNRTRKES